MVCSLLLNLLNREIVKVNTGEDYGRTLLLRAAENGYEVVFKLLLAIGKADIDKKDNSGRTPLSWAVGGGHEAVVELLLDKGAHVKLKDKYGRTPLSYAAANGHEAVAKLLERT